MPPRPVRVIGFAVRPASLARTALRTVLACGALLLVCGCRPAPASSRIQLSYWEKWTGAEAAAMQATVDAFNASQDRIQVNLVSTSQADRKVLIATAGGDPPDLAGLWLKSLPSFADRDALLPLDDFMRADGIEPEAWLARYAPAYSHLGRHEGRTYALPTTTTAVALHWNKALFRAAGLDPERPPRDLAELEDFSRRLTRRDAAGNLVQAGFLPQDPGWWLWAQPLWFGGQFFDADGRVSVARDPASTASFVWLRAQTEEYGLASLQRFSSGFGAFASAQNAFFSGKVAMVVQGVWFNRFINEFAPGLEYGVGAWPSAAPSDSPDAPFTLIDADLIVIPRGARHPEASWEFLRYLASNNPRARARAELQGMEIVCFLQQKTSPLREWSSYFTENHPHPHALFFKQLESSPGARHLPPSGVWQEYERELTTAAERIRLLDATPADALGQVQQRMETSLSLHQASLERQRRAAAK
ncbi:MAG: ABC transporter substrate-binding protein [Burkholderiales bacterium]|nr:ABC transporter substrate-binding protein [Opitutaceae bacterium]